MGSVRRGPRAPETTRGDAAYWCSNDHAIRQPTPRRAAGRPRQSQKRTDRTALPRARPSAAWQKYTSPAEGGIDNAGGGGRESSPEHLVQAATRCATRLPFGAGDLFAGQGAAGERLSSERLLGAVPRRAGDGASPSNPVWRSPAFELPTLVDTMGALFAEAVATYEQDFGEVQKGTEPGTWSTASRRRRRRAAGGPGAALRQRGHFRRRSAIGAARGGNSACPTATTRSCSRTTT